MCESGFSKEMALEMYERAFMKERLVQLRALSQATNRLQAGTLRCLWQDAEGLRAGDTDSVLSVLGRRPEN